MKRIAVALGLMASIGAITLAAQRITTYPADEYLKKLFPDAPAILPHAGSPLHWKIYGVDPKTNPNAQPVALAFWSTDIVPNEIGYRGPTHMFVGMDMTGIIVGAITVYTSDPYGYFSVEPPEFAAQFKGKSVRAPFRVGEDIHGVSRASMTVNSATRAVRDSARTMAKLFLNPAMVK
jgi:transcriptional regulator of nitric oxide reductase